MNCKECYYYDSGTCHRYPPIFTGGEYAYYFPTVFSDDWCGEFAEFIGAPDKLEQLSTEDAKAITTEEKRKK